MRKPRLRDTDGTEYDPETGQVVQAELPSTDETVAALAELTAKLAECQRADDIGVTEEQWLIIDEAGCVPDSATSVAEWKFGPFSFVGLHGDEPLLEVEALDVLTEKTGDA